MPPPSQHVHQITFAGERDSNTRPVRCKPIRGSNYRRAQPARWAPTRVFAEWTLLVHCRCGRRRAANLSRVNLDGNQTTIREVCDAGLLSGAVTVVWQRGELLQVNEIGYRDVEAGLPMQQGHFVSHRVDDQTGYRGGRDEHGRRGQIGAE